MTIPNEMQGLLRVLHEVAEGLHVIEYRLGMEEQWMAAVDERLTKLEAAIYPLHNALEPYLRYNQHFESEGEARVAHALLNIALRGLEPGNWNRFPDDVQRRQIQEFVNALSARASFIAGNSKNTPGDAGPKGVQL